MVDWTKPQPGMECGKMVMVKEKHGYIDCLKQKAKVKARNSKQPKGEIMEKEEIRKKVSKLQKILIWYQKRTLLPYDWQEYFNEGWFELLNLLKIGISDGKIKKKDKRGYWR